MFLPLLGAQDAVILASLPLLEPWSVPNAPNQLNGVHIWTPYIGANGWSVVSGGIELENQGGIAHGGRLQEDLGTVDQHVAADFALTYSGAGTLVASICARMQGDESLTFYALDIIVVSNAYSLLLLKFLAPSSQITLASVSVPAVTVGTLALDVIGTPTATLRGSLNGAPLISGITDPDIPGGRFAGIQGVSAAAGNRARMDNFFVSLAQAARPHRRRGLTPLTGVH